MTTPPNTASSEILILLVEDYDGDAVLIQEKLRISKITGYTLHRTTSMAETTDWLDGNSPEVILLDMNIGDSAGLATVNTVCEAAGDAAIVVLTGTQDQDQELGFGALEAGAQDFLGKDEINARNLRRIVAYAMSRRSFQMRSLKDAIERYQLMAKESATFAHPEKSGDSMSQAINPDVSVDLTNDYRKLLKSYLDSLVVNKAKPTLDMQDIVKRLGDAGAGPKDVLALHVTALEDAVAEARPERARYLNTDGRLLALEVMGRLVAYYRAAETSNTPDNGGPNR